MPSPESNSDDLIDLEQAANRLGLRADFLRWALEAGLLLGIKGQFGDWQLCLGDADAGPIPPLTGSDAAAPPAPAQAVDDVAPQVPVTPEPTRGETATPAPPEEAPELPGPPPARAPDGNGSQVADVLRDQIEHLRRQIEQRDRSIAEKDAAIADMAARCVELGSRAIARIPVEGTARAYAPAPPPSLHEAAESAQRQERINERHESAIAHIRDTLLMVRNYLAQLEASNRKAG